MAPRQANSLWQPPGWSPSGAVAFLRGLIEGGAALGAWANRASDARWGERLIALGLAPYTWRQLKTSGYADDLPGELGQALRGAYYTAAGDAELHTAELRAVLTRLATVGVTPVLFKGAALAHTAYPDPACRPMGDLDLWVTEEEMLLAQAALAATGYREHTKGERPPAMQRQMDGEVQLIGTGPGCGLVELHWGIFSGEWLRRTATVDSAGIRHRTRIVQIAGCSARSLAPEDAVIHLAVHLAVNHQMAFPGVRGVLDVAMLARAEQVDWHVLVERARNWRVATPTWLVLDLAEELFGLSGAAKLSGATTAIASLAPSRQRQALLRRFADIPHLLEGRDLTKGGQRLAFQLLLVDRTKDAARLVGRTLWPEGEWLRARYGAGAVGPGLRTRHLTRVARGRI